VFLHVAFLALILMELLQLSWRWILRVFGDVFTGQFKKLD
jgi:hypothetical protein